VFVQQLDDHAAEGSHDDLQSLLTAWLTLRMPVVRIIWLYGPEATIHNRIIQFLTNSETPSTPIIYIPCGVDTEPLQLFYCIGAELARRGYASRPTHQNPPRHTHFGSAAEMAAAEFWFHIGYPTICGMNALSKHSTTIIIDGLHKCGKYQAIELILTTITETLLGFDLPLRFIITAPQGFCIHKVSHRPLLFSGIFIQFFVDEYHANPQNDPAMFRSCLQHGFSPEVDPLVDNVERMKKVEVVMSALEGVSFVGYWQPYLKITTNLVRATTNLNERDRHIASLLPTGAATLICDMQKLDDLFVSILRTHSNHALLIFVLGIFFAIGGKVDITSLLDQVYSITPEASHNVLEVLALFTIVSGQTGEYLRPQDITPFFSDFLLTQRRSRQFYVDILLFHEVLAVHGFLYIMRHLSEPPM